MSNLTLFRLGMSLLPVALLEFLKQEQALCAIGVVLKTFALLGGNDDR
tara:strand:+ start:26 stop:169 length:144 start_codon:yes stop_codon:yes gene_type:complete